MLKFKSLKACPKCNEPRINGENNRFKHKYHRSGINEDLNICEGVESIIMVEHLDITCSSCKYVWVEAPADYKEEKNIQTTITTPTFPFHKVTKAISHDQVAMEGEYDNDRY